MSVNAALGQIEPASQVWTDPVTGAITGVLTRQGVLQVAGVQAAGAAVISAPLVTQLLTAPAAAITFSAIPGTFSQIRVLVNGASASATESDRWLVRVNGDSGNNYDLIATQGNGTPVTNSGARVANSSWIISIATPGEMPGANATAGTAGLLEVILPNYAGTTFQKTGFWRSGYADAATAAADMSISNGLAAWRSTAAITSVTVAAGSGSNLVAGTTAYLYGS